MNNESEKLQSLLEERSVSGSAAAEAAEKMLAFEDLVLERNRVINLTAITERDEFLTKHLIDSCSCYDWPEIDAASRIVDVGTGAGFPGVPLAILYPAKKFTLIDSLGKRTQFIEDAVEALGMTNIQVFHMRAEDAGRDNTLREKFDLCVTRAVASLSVLEEYCLPLLKVGGYLYAYKTKQAEIELPEGKLARQLTGGAGVAESRAIDIFGLKPTENGAFMAKQNAPNDSYRDDAALSRRIFVIRKERPTPRDYPRKAGIPTKIPL
ncbi:MAG: 16S rRNA (guanine(527)-N(7))-methyltransferase RsmG [Clostridiales Family XIII bacterium]|nr:16S rRNA (guanine(527)-N(7))-methyltransferase RsmG [Clostridiales Family XIII bacterium]